MSRADVQRMLEKERGEASRIMPGGRIELTGATDEDGVLVELTSFDIERMGGAEVVKFFSREDVDRIVSGRLAREQKRTRQRVAQLERERDELEWEVEGLRRLTPGVDRGL